MCAAERFRRYPAVLDLGWTVYDNLQIKIGRHQLECCPSAAWLLSATLERMGDGVWRAAQPRTGPWPRLFSNARAFNGPPS